MDIPDWMPTSIRKLVNDKVDVENMSEALSQAKKDLDRADQLIELAKSQQELSGNFKDLQKINEAQKHLKQVRDKVGTASQIASTASSLLTLAEAVQTLDKTMPKLRNNPGNDQLQEEAALAFGQLFVGAGELAEGVPGAGMYAPFLKEMGSFFDNARHGVGLGPYHMRTRKLEQSDPNYRGVFP